MQVLGDLIRLPGDGCSLPVPWWQRAPLGFLDGTNLYIGLVQSSRPVGDIVVSVLDIHKWDNMLRLDCTHEDGPGIVADLMEIVQPLNIALAETVTTETGNDHRATLFCEDKGAARVKNSIPIIMDKLKNRNFRNITLDPYLSDTKLSIIDGWNKDIDHGWIRDVAFLSSIQQNYTESVLRNIELNQVVVSADTENRLLRYLFPRKGTKALLIHHADRPGALLEIFKEFAFRKINVLSAILRRGGQERGYSELLAVCEPREPLLGAWAAGKFYQELKTALERKDKQFGIKVSVKEATPPEEVLYLPSPGEQRGGKKGPLLLAHRHAKDGDPPRELYKEAKSVVEDNGWYFVEAPAAASAETSGFEAVISSMNRAEASIVIVTGFDQSSSGNFLRNLAFEFGYLRALCKPVLVLTEVLTEPEVINTLQNWADGWAACEQVAENDFGSLSNTLSRWLRNVRA